MKDTAKSRVPVLLSVLGLALVLGAFSRAGQDETKQDEAWRATESAFDPASIGGADDSAGDDQGSGSTRRRSNRVFTLLQLDSGRFYALYGPAQGGESAPPVAGVLVGDRSTSTEHAQTAAAPGAAPNATLRTDRAASRNLHDFSLESGALRVTTQEGRFDPARFVDGDTVRVESAAVEVTGGASAANTANTADTTVGADAALAGRYTGRLSDAAGGWPATFAITAHGDFTLSTPDGCNARGRTQRHGGAPVWDVVAAFGDGCAHAGAALQGHALRRGNALYLLLAAADLASGAVFVGKASR